MMVPALTFCILRHIIFLVKAKKKRCVIHLPETMLFHVQKNVNSTFNKEIDNCHFYKTAEIFGGKSVRSHPPNKLESIITYKW